MNQKQASEQNINHTIQLAINRIGARKENDLCRYLPGPNGGYIHHFTLKKMKVETPQELESLLNEFILKPASPKKLPHKPRAPRGSRKRLELLNFSRQDMERLLQMVRQSGDKEMIRKLTPKRDLKGLKRELILMIKHERVDLDLWNGYVELVSSLSSAQAAGLGSK